MLPWRERFHPPAEAGKSIPISIHAPAKGATYPCRCRHCAYIISIHAPAWGATEVQKWLDIQKHYFNPRSRMGSDNTGRISCTHHQNFNPRSREGSDIMAVIIFTIAVKFQSTLPRRERLPFGETGKGILNFNPRSREGSDEPARACIHAARNFNPRSREGSDP